MQVLEGLFLDTGIRKRFRKRFLKIFVKLTEKKYLCPSLAFTKVVVLRPATSDILDVAAALNPPPYVLSLNSTKCLRHLFCRTPSVDCFVNLGSKDLKLH